MSASESGPFRTSLREVALITAVASTLLVILAIPRFGALTEPPNSVGIEHTTPGGRHIEGMTVDMREYLLLTEFYAGDGPAPDMAPFTYRLGVPAVAGRLPWDSVVDFNIVVLSTLMIGLGSMLLAQRRWGCTPRSIAAAAALYSISFPVFYWSSFNYVDGAVVGALGVLLLFIAYNRLVGAAVVVGVSVLLKEWALVGLPVVVTWIWFTRPRVARWWLSLAAVAAAFAGFVGSRVIGPTARTFYNPWIPSLQEIQHYVGWNMSRPGPIAQSVLTAAPLGVALWVSWRAYRRASMVADPGVLAALVVGVGGVALLAAWSFLAAQWDGRAMWTAYPFALTLLALALSSRTGATWDEPGRRRAGVDGAASAASVSERDG